MLNRFLILHILFWLTITGLSLYFKVVIHQFSNGLVVSTIIDVMLLATLSYFSIYLNSVFYEKRKLFYYAISILVMVVVITVLRYQFEYLMFNFYNIKFQTFASRMITAKVITTIIFVGFGVVYSLTKNHFKRKDEMLKNEAHLLQLELDFHKARVNPHFLFNTLGNIHALIIQKSDAAAAAVLNLADLMRYMFYDCQEDLVPLHKEVEFLHHYVELYKIRSTRKLDITFSEDLSGGTTIEPLLFVSFVENAFKHGDIYQEGELRIAIVEKEGKLTFSCFNTYKPNFKSKTNKQSGFGIENVKKRLNLLYPDQHKIIAESKGSTFKVELRLNLNRENE